MYVYRYLYRNLDQYRTRFLLIFGVGVLYGFVSFYSPVLLANFTRGALSLERFQWLVLYLIGLNVLTIGLDAIIIRWGGDLNALIGNHLRLKQFHLLEKLQIKDLTKHHSGYVLSIVNQMSGNMNMVMNGIFRTYATGIGTVVLFFYYTARESLPIAFWNLFVLVGISIVSSLMSRKMTEFSSELNVKQSSLMGGYSDFMANIVTIKKLAVYAFARQRLEDRTNATYDVIRRRQIFGAKRWSLLDALFSFAFLSTIAFLLYRIVHGALPASVLILFVAGYGRINGLVDRITDQVRLVMEEHAYIEKVEEFVAPAYKETKHGNNQEWTTVMFKNVRFQYPEHDRHITIPSFILHKGQKVMLAGTSGEGKTTFLNLLANFLEPQEGERTVDQTPYAVCGREFFQNRMVMISQEVELFNLTLRDNITLGRAMSDDAINRALAHVDLLEWTKHLEKGLDTIVGEKGVKLSAGQKQRINLLRGVLLDRDIYLLDEPTSHLDAATEEKMIAFLKNELATKTVVIVSHKDSLRSMVDHVYQMKDHTLVRE